MRVFPLVHDAKGGHNMKTTWYNASVEKIVRDLKQYPSYRNNFLKGIVKQKEKVWRNNPVAIDCDEHLFERLYKVAELPNTIFGGYTYRSIFNFIKEKDITKEDLAQLYEDLGKITPIWVIESFEGPLVTSLKKGPYTIFFFNETPTE